MSDWPKYESHKIVQAAKIVAIDRTWHDSTKTWEFIRCQVDTGDGNWEDFTPTVAGMGEKATVGDWAMLYPDGFKSISPAKAFEEGYTRVPD